MTPPLPTPRLTPAFAVALAGAVLLLLLQAMPGVLSTLEYRRAVLAAEPWRLLTAHIVHINWTHAAVNAGAWLVLARLFEPRLDAKRQLLSLLFGAAVISLSLAAFYPSIAWYRGASGALHALFFAGACASLVAALRRRSPAAVLLPLALLAGGWIKVALEMPRSAATPYAGWLAAATVPQAHLFGAIAGTALGLLLALRQRRDGA
jgi:rhomboid family GlyGly-CTERM serine protease